MNRTQWNEKIDDVVAGLDGPSGAMSAWMDGLTKRKVMEDRDDINKILIW